LRTVSQISVTPVRCFRLQHPEAVELTTRGVVENRRFYLADGDGRRLRSSLTAWPVVVSGEYDAAREELRMRFPDGREVEGSARGLGTTIQSDFSGRAVEGRVVDGPWTDPLSDLAGHDVRVARPAEPGMCQDAPVTLVSTASIARLAREAGASVDGRRFRMLFVLDGCAEHEEDEWGGRRIRIGEATLTVGGPVARCAVTTRDPDTGERDLDTLGLIKGYRGVRDGEAIDFGVYATVTVPGRVASGDSVELL
jgi:uncharacterized protein YcbX